MTVDRFDSNITIVFSINNHPLEYEKKLFILIKADTSQSLLIQTQSF